MSRVLVFDMDGVLVDVSESYRTTIIETVRHFTGQDVSHARVQSYKNQGGWNNDWALSQRLILDIAGIDVPYEQVVDVFQKLFLGDNNDGLILRERWIATAGLLERLSERHPLAIFTGRLMAEVELTLNRFAPDLRWSMIVADDTVARSKPAPDGLFDIARAHSGSELLYFGDTPDDARSARAAGVPFIGVIANGNRATLQAEGAQAVIESINQIEEVL